MQNPFNKELTRKETVNFTAVEVETMAYNMGRLAMAAKCAQYGPHLTDLGGFLAFDDVAFIDEVATALGYEKGSLAYVHFKQGARDELRECMG